ncbi:RNA polymerase sigma factor SigZ [Marinobacter hydrocarbonoclasticus]|nr:RNA polymerase sigma factor SigZ [Marinobacter nauticus]
MENHWQQHRIKLQRYIARQVKDAATVEDLLQEVYIKAHTQLHQLKAQGSLGAWLHRIAHNVVMDHYRQQKPFDELPDDIPELAAEQPAQAHQELALCLEPLMDELPPQYREPLKMVELKGMSQQAVASELGLSLSGAKSRVQRARTQLREKLTACCEVEIEQGNVTEFRPKDPGCHC